MGLKPRFFRRMPRSLNYQVAMEEQIERELSMLSLKVGRLLSEECKGHKPKIHQGGKENEVNPGFCSTLIYLCTLHLTEVGYNA